MEREQILQLIEERARAIAEEVYSANNVKYGVANTPLHMHNGIDSPRIPPTSIVGYETLPAGLRGVLAPAQLQGNVLINPQANRLAYTYGAPTFVSEGLNGWGGGAGPLMQLPTGGPVDTYFLFANFSSDGDWHGVELDI